MNHSRTLIMVNSARIFTVAIVGSVSSYALLTSTASAQTNISPPVTTNQFAASIDPAKSEHVRTNCINDRRRICGRVLQIDPDGLVVDSGYTSLLRPELAHSWVIGSNVAAGRPPHRIEAHVPGSVCVGVVFVTDIPKKPAVKVYDYVVLQAYPTGEYAYTPVGAIHKSVRRFSTNLEKAVEVNLQIASQAQTHAEK